MRPLSPFDLSPAPYNPRRLAPEAAAGLSRSLVEFGDIAGITWNARTKRLVTGHQRLAQLRQLHGDKLRIDVLPDDGGDRAQLVAPDGSAWAVRIVDWPEEREKAANIAANNPLIGGGGARWVAIAWRIPKRGEADRFSGERRPVAQLEASPSGKPITQTASAFHQ